MNAKEMISTPNQLIYNEYVESTTCANLKSMCKSKEEGK